MTIDAPSLEQRSMDGLLQYREWMTATEREWLARHDAGQHAEVWEVEGGCDVFAGFTVLWVPEERLLWAFNCGLPPTWYANASGPGDILTIWSWAETHPLQTLPYYLGLKTTCEDCGRRLSAEERAHEMMMAEAGEEPPECLLCSLCWEITYAEINGSLKEK